MGGWGQARADASRWRSCPRPTHTAGIGVERALDDHRLRRRDGRAERLVRQLRHVARGAPLTAIVKRLVGCTVNVLTTVVPFSRRNVAVRSAGAVPGLATRMYVRALLPPPTRPSARPQVSAGGRLAGAGVRFDASCRAANTARARRPRADPIPRASTPRRSRAPHPRSRC